MASAPERRSFLERYGKWAPAAFLIFLVGVYTLLFARLLLDRQYTSGGDTQLYWSFRYMLFYSLKHFGTLPWWDPQVYNGYPLYFYIISGWTNYLGPFTLPSLVLFKLLTLVWDVNINDYLVFQQTIYPFTLNLIVIYLISRQLTKSTIASLLPPFLFTFSYYQYLNFHDFYAYEAMIAPLFFLYGLIRYNNARTPKNLMLFLLLTGLLFASLQNGIVMSAAYWGGLFTVLLVLFHPGIVGDTVRAFKESLQTRSGKAVFSFLLALAVIGFASAWTPLALNEGHLVKYRNTVVQMPDGRMHGYQAPLEYETAGGGITNHPVPIQNSEIWSILLNWLPFPEIHYYLLRFAWDSHEFRYIGLVTVPLIISALILARKNRYVYVSALTFFICNAFFIYADKNLVYKVLFDFSGIVQNITNVSTILPRGGASLFLLFLAGIGLDAVLAVDDAGSPEGADLRLYRNTLAGFLVLSIVLVGLGVIAWSVPSYKWMRHTLFHIGFYLIIFFFLCRMLLTSRSPVVVRSLLACLFLFASMDMTVAASSYTLSRFSAPAETTSKHILIPYKDLADRGMVIPDTLQFRPIKDEREQMYPPNYMGVYHNVEKIQWGTKEWLYFGTRDEGAKLLTNWNMETRRMKVYPAFQIYSNAFYIPFGAIKDLDRDKSWYDTKPLFYLHDQRLVFPEEPRQVTGGYDLTEYTYNSVGMVVRSAEQGWLYFLDNYDRFWKAYLDGERVPIHRANFTFKAIRLPAGDHRVRWVYDPWPVKLLYGLYYALLFGGAAWYGREWYREKRGRRSPAE